jgi:hypothetical protein
MPPYKSKEDATKKLIEHIRKNGKDRSWAQLSKMFAPGLSEDWARSMMRSKGYNTTTNQFAAEGKVEYTKQTDSLRKQRHESTFLARRIIQLESEVEFLTDFKQHKPQTFNILPPSSNKNHEATVITQWSDWHVDEVVKPSTINGFNEYNPTIVEKRAKKLFENTVKLVQTQRAGVIIKTAIIHLGGDLVTGWIHPEGMQTNSMTPQEGMFFAYDLHVAGIEYLLKYGEFNEIFIICSRGNHGRITHKMQYANDYATNNENYAYKMLANYFRNNSKVKFQIDDAELAYMNVYGKLLRFFHGWQIRFKGGIGGLTIPLYKALHRWDKNLPTYYNFMADKHSYSRPTPDCVLNGSLVGFNAYAMSNGFTFEPPRQSFTLLDSKRGITIKAPIFCE